MCQKPNITKRFFLLIHHAHPTQQPQVLSVLKEGPFINQIHNQTQFSSCLRKQDVLSLGKTPVSTGKDYLIPVDIPRDWFLH
jgi:hypothetical protein